jgi:hypothetical protein
LNLYVFSATASPADKRQLQAVVAGQVLLQQKLNSNEISSDIIQKVDGMIDALVSKNFAVASSIQMVSA